jgi:hypothetical protein
MTAVEATMKLQNIALVCLLAGTSLARAQDVPAPPANPNPIIIIGRIIAHAYEGDGNGSHHSVVVIISDDRPNHAVTIEFNRMEPALVIGLRFSISCKPLMDGNNVAILSNNRQVHELDEENITIDPPIVGLMSSNK